MRLAILLSFVGSLSLPEAIAQHGHSHPAAQANHTDSTAQQVEKSANAVAWEMHTHYRSFPDFREVYRECKEMWAISRHCHDLLHNSISNTRLRNNVQDLDEVFHHLQQHVTAWSPGHGSELRRRMDALQANLHHLMLDAGVPQRQYPVAGSPPAPGSGTFAPNPPAPFPAAPSSGTANSQVPVSPPVGAPPAPALAPAPVPAPAPAPAPTPSAPQPR